MLKKAKLILIATLLLSGCSTTNNESNKETKSVPEEMEASKYVGQGFQPPAEKDAIEFAKKHISSPIYVFVKLLCLKKLLILNENK